MRETKECLECGGIYFRAEHVTDAQWEARKYCSPSCAGKAATRRNREKKEEEAAGIRSMKEVVMKEPALANVEGYSVDALLPGPIYPLDPVAAQTVKPKEPVMRELKIVRVGPNPRMILCEYYELAERRVCTVNVKKNDKFVKGMRLQMPEPRSDEDYRKPWVYQGRVPRLRGRW